MKKKLILLIIVFGFILYGNTLKNPFVWDDTHFIQNSDFIKKFSNSRAFLSPGKYFKYTQDLTYRPLPFLLLMLNYKISGTNPVSYRLSNVILHIINALLLFIMIFYLFKNKVVAFLSSLIFLIHPVHTEVVNMVSFNETLISAMFFILSIILYLKSKEKNSVKLLYISVLLYFLGLFCKENMIMVVGVLVLYDYLFEKRIYIKKILPYLLVTVFYLYIRFFVFREPRELLIKYPGDSFLINILAMLKYIPAYLKIILFPVSLSVERKMSVPDSMFETDVFSGLILLLVFIAMLIYCYKKFPYIFFFLLWIPITFLPTSNIIPMENIMAERYLYIPIIGFCVIFAAIIKEPFGDMGTASIVKSMKFVSGICVIACLLVFTIIRNMDWTDELTFFSKVLKQAPDSAGAHLNLGLAYLMKKDYNNAIKLMDSAIRIAPEYARAYNNRGRIYHIWGNNNMAISDFSTGLKYSPDFARLYYNRGNVYAGMKSYDRALADYNKVLEIDPISVHTYYFRGNIYYATDRQDKALEDYSQVIKLDSNYFLAYYNRGNIYFDRNNYAKAILDYSKAIKIKNDYIDAYLKRGNIYFNLKKYNKSISDYDMVIKISSSNREAYYSRGNIFYLLDNYDKAMSDYNKALDIDVNYAEVYCNRGSVYLAGKKYYKAIEDFNSALKINPDYAKAYNNRGNVYYYLKAYDKAIKDYTRAIEIEPGYALAYSNRAAGYHELRDYIKLKEDVEKLKKLNYPVKAEYLKNEIIEKPQ